MAMKDPSVQVIAITRNELVNMQKHFYKRSTEHEERAKALANELENEVAAVRRLYEAQIEQVKHEAARAMGAADAIEYLIRDDGRLPPEASAPFPPTFCNCADGCWRCAAKDA